MNDNNLAGKLEERKIQRCPTCGQLIKGGQKPGLPRQPLPTPEQPIRKFPFPRQKPGQPEGGMRTAVVVRNKCGEGWHHPNDLDTSCQGEDMGYQQPRRPGISKPTYPLPYPKKYRR